MDAHNLKIVATDLFRRHFLVYDESFKKIGSLDCCKGVWTFTLAETMETWFGLSRHEALRSFLVDPDRKVASIISALGPAQVLKSTL